MASHTELVVKVLSHRLHAIRTNISLVVWSPVAEKTACPLISLSRQGNQQGQWSDSQLRAVRWGNLSGICLLASYTRPDRVTQIYFWWTMASRKNLTTASSESRCKKCWGSSCHRSWEPRRRPGSKNWPHCPLRTKLNRKVAGTGYGHSTIQRACKTLATLIGVRSRRRASSWHSVTGSCTAKVPKMQHLRPHLTLIWLSQRL